MRKAAKHRVNRGVAAWVNSIGGVADTCISTVTLMELERGVLMMRAQLFWDGNKRTALICTNYLLIHAGAGILNISEQQLETWPPAFRLLRKRRWPRHHRLDISALPARHHLNIRRVCSKITFPHLPTFYTADSVSG